MNELILGIFENQCKVPQTIYVLLHLWKFSQIKQKTNVEIFKFI